MRLVSDNSDEQLQRRRVEADLRRALRVMAVNLMRVVRGAGRPYQIGIDLFDCMASYQAYREIFGSYPDSGFIQAALDPEAARHSDTVERQEHMAEWLAAGKVLNSFEAELKFNEQQLMRAGLQMAASKLADQKMQLRQAESDMYRAARDIRSAIESANKQAMRSYSVSTQQKWTKESAARNRSSKSPPVAPRQPKRPVQSASTPCDPFEPPSYAGLRSARLPPSIAEEFGEQSASALVARLNALWRQQGRLPLPQGSYPTNANQLSFVVKELRIALASERV